MSFLSTDAIRATSCYPEENMIKIQSQPVDIAARVGAHVKLSADAKALHLSFQWYNGQGLPIPLEKKNYLSFAPVKKEDFGFYRLEILDRVTEEKALTRWAELKQPELFVAPFVTPINVTVYKPKLLTDLSGGTYKKGDTITLTAFFDKATAYQWYKDGEKLKGCKGNNLVISNANMSNNGVYVLSATNYPFSGVIETTQAVRVVVTF